MCSIAGIRKAKLEVAVGGYLLCLELFQVRVRHVFGDALGEPFVAHLAGGDGHVRAW